VPLAVRSVADPAANRPLGGDRGWRRSVVVAADIIAWVVAVVIGVGIQNVDLYSRTLTWLTVLAVALQVMVGIGVGLYRNRYRPGTFDELGAVVGAVGAVGIVLVVVEQLAGKPSTYGRVVIMATAIAASLMLGHRFLRRMRAQSAARKASVDRTPVLVLGAGEGGYRAIKSMESVLASPYRPVALIDDDPSKRPLRISGVKVEGTTDDLRKLAQRFKATSVLIAIPSASGELMRQLHEKVQAAGLETLVMPPPQKLLGHGSPREITRYRDEDVLNRKIVDIDRDAVREIIAGYGVMVTGAGGSIGSELVRQLVHLEPASLLLVDRDDSLLHAAMSSIPDHLHGRCRSLLVDIRDTDRLHEVFAEHRPQVVFHAAALKHLPALEDAPGEGWKTNVVGTANVIEACEQYGVVRLVNISTDKAANPANVLGYTKRIAERLTAAAALRKGQPYVSVRFGNVIGSRGSVIETFDSQIANGGPVTVTHPEVTRYFMAVREAVLLTMQAAAIGRGGEVLVLDMGEPVSVVNVARQLIDRAPSRVEIEFVGLRPGEKMHEVLLGDGEAASRPFHPMIDHVAVPPLDLVTGLDACAAARVSPMSVEGLQMVTNSGTAEIGRLSAAKQPTKDASLTAECPL
jgi:FlaA1/EpsC-like NDP-sugar epimerase